MKMNVKQIIKKLEMHKARIAKERDAMREFFDEVESLLDDWNGAEEDLESAIDRLSRLV